MKYTAIEKTYKNCLVTVKRYEDNVISLDVYESLDEYERCIFSMDLTDDIMQVMFLLNNIEDSQLVQLIEEMYNEITL